MSTAKTVFFFFFLIFTEGVYVNRRKRELARCEARKAWILARAFHFLARSRLFLKRPCDATTYNQKYGLLCSGRKIGAMNSLNLN